MPRGGRLDDSRARPGQQPIVRLRANRTYLSLARGEQPSLSLGDVSGDALLTDMPWRADDHDTWASEEEEGLQKRRAWIVDPCAVPMCRNDLRDDRRDVAVRIVFLILRTRFRLERRAHDTWTSTRRDEAAGLGSRRCAPRASNRAVAGMAVLQSMCRQAVDIRACARARSYAIGQRHSRWDVFDTGSERVHAPCGRETRAIEPLCCGNRGFGRACDASMTIGARPVMGAHLDCVVVAGTSSRRGTATGR